MKNSDVILMGTTTMKKKLISNQTFTTGALVWDFQPRKVNEIIFFPKSKTKNPKTPQKPKRKKRKKNLLLIIYLYRLTWDKAASRCSITAFISSAIIFFLRSLVLCIRFRIIAPFFSISIPVSALFILFSNSCNVYQQHYMLVRHEVLIYFI